MIVGPLGFDSRPFRRFDGDTRLKTRQMLAFFLAGPLLLCASAQTLSPAGNEPVPSEDAQAPSISDRKLSAVAAAVPGVEDIRMNYQAQFAQARGTDRASIAVQEKKEMTKTIADQGLSIDEYNSILKAAASYPSIRSRLLEILSPSERPLGP